MTTLTRGSAGRGTCGVRQPVQVCEAGTLVDRVTGLPDASAQLSVYRQAKRDGVSPTHALAAAGLPPVSEPPPFPEQIIEAFAHERLQAAVDCYVGWHPGCNLAQ